ncbi:type II secretion system minor pseudopilin GspJ [Maricaulis sp.]|uniref:type II secretion system minor pseudopilin GspJ n=1 Tax=Maricaulis sp. TaxID=1486257 RepID=UPI001B0073E9|nr:type II secretion system minor pseudopilin GspJ [Maricaulis sp.]MBO6766426.1 type II secretion system minor pseudopilin GspJ [Maricaulis sp.]
MSAAAPAREAGFSLVEILVSVFVFAIIGTISVALMASSVGAREINSDVLERTAMIDRARTLLREDLGQIARRAVRDEAGYRDPWILAGAATGLADYETDATERVLMVFTRHGRANPGLIRPRSSLLHVTYLIRGGDLVRRVRDYPDPGEATRITDQVLIAGGEDFTIEFLVGAVWQNRVFLSQTGQGVMPAAVRLRYDLPPLGAMEHVLLTPEAQP